jgi:hypothetical protein
MIYNLFYLVKVASSFHAIKNHKSIVVICIQLAYDFQKTTKRFAKNKNEKQIKIIMKTCEKSKEFDAHN